MPKVEVKTIQRELEQGLVWPLYWIYGTESWKSRELLLKIRHAVLGTALVPGGFAGLHGMGLSEVNLEGGETTSDEILDATLSTTLGGGVPLVIIRDAHALKNSERLSDLVTELLPQASGSAKPLAELSSVCVFLSKDLDGRKKFSKVLLERAAVVPCEEVPENQREVWIQFLAKRRDLSLESSLIMKLLSLDPWSLDIVDQELEKFSLSGSELEIILEGSSGLGGEAFLEGFFSRDLSKTLSQVADFADHPDESLLLLGLLGWNVRQMAILISDQKNGTRHSKLSPFLADRFRRWSRFWTLSEVIELQRELAEMDFCLKQSPLMPLGMWSQLVTQFCQS